MVTITEQLLEQGMSDNGALNRAQLDAILPHWEFTGSGTWSIKKGWKERLIGSKVGKGQIDEFLRLKNKHLTKKRDFEQRGLFEQRPDYTKDAELLPEDYRHMQSIKQELKEPLVGRGLG